MKRQCGICGQCGDYKAAWHGQTFMNYDNPLSWYEPAASLICNDCREECGDDLVGAVNDAAMARSAERAYLSGIDYACGYRD